MVGALLTRGMLVGILAGISSFGFLKLVGEPPVDRAIAFEPAMDEATETGHRGCARLNIGKTAELVTSSPAIFELLRRIVLVRQPTLRPNRVKLCPLEAPSWNGSCLSHGRAACFRYAGHKDWRDKRGDHHD